MVLSSFTNKEQVIKKSLQKTLQALSILKDAICAFDKKSD